MSGDDLISRGEWPDSAAAQDAAIRDELRRRRDGS
jgi:hypothetical protein